ncbi:hypothetical protein ABK040_001115 [Willaertia magna]
MSKDNEIMFNNNPVDWLQNVSDSCFLGDLERLQLLLEQAQHDSKHYNINKLDKNNQLSPLHRTCSKNQSNILSHLLEANVHLDFKIKDKVQATPLHLAAANNAIDCILILTTVKGAKHLVEIRDCYGKTPFHVAFRFRNYEAMKILIQAFGNDIVNVKSLSSESCLHIAAKEHDLKAIKFLIDNGAKSMKDENGKTPLGVAVTFTDILSTKQDVRKKLQHSKSMTITDELCAFKEKRRNISCSNIEECEKEEKKIPIKYKDYLCYGLLMEEEIEKFGLNRWMNNIVDVNNGRNIIQAACELGNSRFLSLCALSLPKEIYQQMIMATDKSGKNSLHIAAEKGHYEVIQQIFLLLKDIDKSLYKSFLNHQEPKEKNTPLHSAILALKKAEKKESERLIELSTNNSNVKVITSKEIRRISQCIIEIFDNPLVDHSLRNIRSEKAKEMLEQTTFFSQLFFGCKSSTLF